MDSFLFETERLRLRPLLPNDVDELFKILGDAETMKYYPAPKTLDETKAWIKWSVDLYKTRGMGFMALIFKDTGNFVGECGFLPQKIDDKEFIEIGYHVNKKYWRQGLASEAAIACRNYAFKKFKVAKVISLVRPENIPSAKVATKSGMTVEKEIIRWDLPHLVYSFEKNNLLI